MAAELPQEIVDRIIDEIALEGSGDVREQARDMKMFCLISSKWLHRSRKYIFHTIEFTSNIFPIWCESVRPGIHGPSPHITCIRYKPSWVQVEGEIGPPEGLFYYPSHMSSFTNLRTLHFVDISLQHTSYLICFGELPATVRELWLENCRMDINQFVSFLQPFTNLELLRLMRPHCADENKLHDSVLVDPPPLKGTLEFYLPKKTASEDVESFIHELSLIPSYFTTIIFRERLDEPKATNKLLVASRRTLTKLMLGHYCKAHFYYRNRDYWFTVPRWRFSHSQGHQPKTLGPPQRVGTQHPGRLGSPFRPPHREIKSPREDPVYPPHPPTRGPRRGDGRKSNTAVMVPTRL